MTSRLEQFLAGDNPDDVAFFLSNRYLDEPEVLADHGELVDDGVVVVVHGEKGRQAFEMSAGVDPMSFSQTAMGTDGHVDRGLADGECPVADTDGDHHVQFVFAFAETRKDELEGLYAEGDVVHAYAQCACGTSYSDRWVAGER